MSVGLADREHKERRLSWNSDGAKSLVGHQLSTSLPRCDRAGIHPDPTHRRPAIDLTAPAGEHLFAATYAQLERVALELVEDFDCKHYARAADIYEAWAQRYAELSDPEQARECHETAMALRQRVELIRALSRRVLRSSGVPR